jgi:hypothetical protein
MKLEDGAGTGTLAKVDDGQRLLVSAISSDRAEQANVDLEAFIMATEIFTISAATETRVAYISNGEASRDLIIDLERFFTTGGNTNFNRPVIMRCHINASEPTANNSLKDPIGTNTGTGQSSAVFVVWDGVGSGLTQTAPGDQLATSIFSIGETDSRIPSKLILGPAKTLTWSFECAEACDVAMSVYVHLG